MLAQSNGSPKTSVSTAVSTVLAHPPGKTRVYLQKTRYTREIPGSASMPRAPTPRAPAPTAARTACSSTRTAPCALAIGAKRQHRRCARHGLQVAVRTMRSCRHSASSATLGRGLHRRVDPLAERPQGALAAHAAGYASRQGLPQNYSPSSGIHTGSLHCLQLCAAAFWCSKTSLHAAQANGPSLPFIALRPVSAPPSERVGVCRVAGVTTLDSGSAPSKNSRHPLARI